MRKLLGLSFVILSVTFLTCKPRVTALPSTLQELNTKDQKKFVYRANRFMVLSAEFVYTVNAIDEGRIKVNTTGEINFMGMSVSQVKHQSINHRATFLPIINTQYDSSSGGRWYSQKFLPHMD